MNNILHITFIRFFKLILDLTIKITPPIQLPPQNYSTGICTLLCHDHVSFFISNIKSLRYFGNICLPITIIDDGTLTTHDVILLRKHLCNCFIITKQIADARIPLLLAKHPFSLRYWKKNKESLFTHNHKLFEPFLLSDYKKCILLDSDILFFKNAYAITRWIKSKSSKTLYMAYPSGYIDTHHTVNSSTVHTIGNLYNLSLNPYFNSGIVCAWRKSYDLNTIEKVLKMIYSLSLEEQWFGEQLSLSSVFSKKPQPKSKHASDPLSPNEYVVLCNTEKKPHRPVCIHYHSHFKKTMIFAAINLNLKIFFNTLTHHIST